MLAGRRVWDAALVAASPILIFQVFTNFDALATGLAVGGLLAWARRKPTLAGVLIGLGVAAKLYPLLLLLPLVVLALRTDRAADAARTVVATVGAWFLVNLPVMMLFPADGRSSSGSTRAAVTTWTRSTTWSSPSPDGGASIRTSASGSRPRC